jgi:hypothetical protein
MAGSLSLDELIGRKAAEFADQLRQTASLADKEEEIRIEAERQLAFIEREAGVKLEGRHEYTVAKGRVDSVYTRVLIEYKNPSSAADRIGPGKESPGAKKVIKQIQDRFRGIKDDHGHPLESLFGVGLDGKHFVFVRFRDKKWDIQDPVEVSKHSAERFLWALFNLGQKGKPFSPEYLAGDFGASETSLAIPGVHALYDAIVATDNPKAQTFFKQWKILFGEVCGYDVDNPSDKIKKLATSYGVPLADLRPAELFFALHTYYAIFMKLLASEIVAFFHKLPTPLKGLLGAPSGNKLREEIGKLEKGGIFVHLNITNFLEGDLFAWYTEVWTDGIQKLLRDLANRLDDYNPGTLSEDPATSRDLLKKLYQQLFPKSVRHDLGEYYTPDWLAEHVLNELGYEGDPDKRLLDPACGSGTFLVVAINRIRKWYEENRERIGYEKGELCQKILANVIGFDLNPLAVMAARTNYLIGIRDLVGYVDRVELPVYLCDSIMTPSEYGLFAGTSLGKAKELKTAAANFAIPTEIATKRDDVAKYAEQLEFCIANEYSPEEFLQRCNDEGLPITTDALHKELYQQLVQLDKENRNGVWARIIKNAFAPLFVGRVDYVAGNPPWVNWESLPGEYRENTVALWDKYRLRERAIRGARLGNVKKELSVLFVYVAVEHYLPKDGKLGFLITQSILKTGANEGFRRFAIDASQPFRVERVSDLSLFLPFEGAINRTAVLIVKKGSKSKYPVPYQLWVPAVPRATVPEADLETVTAGFEIKDWLAAPVEPSVPESAWLTGPRKALPVLQKILGDRSAKLMDRTYAGSCTWLNGVYWVEVIKAGERTSLVRNMGDVGRTKVESVTAQVESELLFPLLRGRDVSAWRADPSTMTLVGHDRADFADPIALSEMKQRFPKAFAFFKRFERPLSSRSGYKQLHKSRKEFYVIGNVGNYTLAPFKVVFKDLSEFLQCSVIGPVRIEGMPSTPVVPDHTVLFVTCESENECHFIAGLLNSIPARVALHGASVGVQTQRYFPTDVSRLRIPLFKPTDASHAEIVRLSNLCHNHSTEGQHLQRLERDLAEATSGIWSIPMKQVEFLMSAYTEIQGFRRRRDKQAETDDFGDT